MKNLQTNENKCNQKGKRDKQKEMGRKLRSTRKVREESEIRQSEYGY